MFGSNILDVVIGLIFIYLILSMLASAINELVMRILYSRGKNLKVAIETMLTDSDLSTALADKFFKSPLFFKLQKSSIGKLPSYISSKRFSMILLDALNHFDKEDVDGSATTPVNMTQLEQQLKSLPLTETKKVLLSLFHESGGDLEKFKTHLENWFNETMDRASGWYKRAVQKMLLLIGLLIALILNADTFDIAEKLNNDPEARAALVDMATDYIAQLDTIDGPNYNQMSQDSNLARIQVLNTQLNHLINNELKETESVLGMGWNTIGPEVDKLKTGSDEWWEFWIYKVFGWLLTAIAISLGAPFWFDLLKKLVNIRNSGKRPEGEGVPPVENGK